MTNTLVLQSKLIPPVPTSTYMRRSSFIKKMKISEQAKLTLLHSGAGYGKSSGLSAYYKDTRAVHSWYSVTEEDDDILPFITYLRYSIQRIIPNFGQSFDGWETPSMYPKEEDLNRWVTLFINELCKIGEPIVIIIDDFHLVDHVFHINYMMEKIIEFLPPHVHLIIATRIRPKWSNLNKLKMTAQLCEITEEDLVFSEEEIAVFYEDYYNKLLSDEEISSIVRITEGWAIAINLLAMHITETEILSITAMKPALHDLFSYLSDEVFKNMKEDQRKWLLSFSIFPVFSERLVHEFFGIEAIRVLQELAGRHVFIQPLGENGAYRYHALFQQFLEEKRDTLDANRFIALQRKAADYYSLENNPVQAIYHAVKSGEDLFVAQKLVDMGASIVKLGQFDWLLDTIQVLPNALRDTYYALHYYEGEAHRYRAFYEKARQSYTACLQLAMLNNDSHFQSCANAGIAHIYLDTIQPGLAEPYLREAIFYGQRSTETSFRDMERLKRQFAENLVNLGKAEEAAIWVEKEKLDESILQEGNLDARISIRTGKLKEAQAILIKRMTNDSTLPDSHRETDVLLSLVYSMTGQVELAKESASRGIELGERGKSGFVEAVGRIRMGHAKMIQDPTELYGPEQYYRQAIGRMEELNVSRGNAEPYMGLSLLKARQGLFTEAIQFGEAGLRETEKVSDGWLSGLIRISLSIVHFYAGNYEESKEQSIVANLLFKACGDTYGELVTLYWLMSVYDKTEESDRFLEQAKLFSELCIRHDYLFFLTCETIFSPFDRQAIYPLFIKAGSNNDGHDEIQQILDQLNLKDVLAHPGYKVEVLLMGLFTLRLGLDEVNDRNWQRDKAKELFVYLLLNRGRYVPKEEIMSNLWEISDEKSADRDFKVALNALLKVLEPHRSARENSFFIIRKQSMYRLNPDADIRTDLDTFRRYKEIGLLEHTPLVAVEHLLKAVALYKGPLFEGKLTIDWLSEEREQVEQQYIDVIERLAQTYTRLREFGKTVYWAEKLLRIDQTWEEAYRLLMYAHFQLQNRPQAVKWYNKCRTVLKEELAIQPMETTEQMYKMIMSQ
ncbi:BTAD domain-containing putative transcriptional regulator [Sporosarcina beigongshangi]|uniref:BTAD domain-containing putative transcriptional regulator n=1 Tax=Sporosarcina beigongshangi TaxID=2782538 RepID=UPI00193A69CE|nr:BTAD domain-containing putative transcriptional regulator [Sporosarcina beigongshangi]